jgi:serine/threonine protein kinase
MKGDSPGSASSFLCPSCWQSSTDGSAQTCQRCAAPAPARGWPSLPCSFRDRYVLIDPMGHDAVSALFRAETGSGGEPVVLVRVARSDGGADAKKLFRREATLAGLLSEETDAFFGLSSMDLTDPAYIAFEHVPWPSLRDALAASGPLDPEAAAHVGVAILRGLAALERHGVVHRAVVPSQIFALRGDDGSWSAKIAGFGVCPEGGDDTRSPEILSHSSPEQLRGEPLTSASDVHMVASVVWELVTGEVPFPLEEGVALDGAARLRLRRLAHVPARPSAMPAELHDLLSLALRPDPRARRTEGAPEGSLVTGFGSALERVAEELPRRREREISLARGDLDTTKRSLVELSARLAPLEALLARKAEIERVVERLATEPESPAAIRRGVHGVELAARELEVDVERALTPPPAPVATTSEPEPPPPPSEPPSAPEPPPTPPQVPREARQPKPAPGPASFPPPSRPSPPPADSVPPSAPSAAPEPTSPKGASSPPEPMDPYDIPGVGKSRWPYVIGILCVVAIVIAIVLAATSRAAGASASAGARTGAAAPAPRSQLQTTTRAEVLS